MSKKEKEIKIINWMKFRKLYFLISGVMIAVSIFSLSVWGLVVGLEFTGGLEVTYQTEVELNQENLDLPTFQKIGDNQYVFSLQTDEDQKRQEILSQIQNVDPDAKEVKFQNVGPSVSQDLIKRTFYAVAISAASILLWVAFQFKSIRFGLSAILAMLHDSFILIGSFAILGHFYGAETDFLFVTAVLTTLSFSVHDTIVVFDRIREISKSYNGSLDEIANKAVTETMRRSIINSLTIIFMLLALVILGGTSIRWFATALLIGAILGTYSSPFVAVPLLTIFDKFKKK